MIQVGDKVFDEKYIILNIEDMRKHLTEEEVVQYNKLATKIVEGRKQDGKDPDQTYLVVKTTEPYAELVAELMSEQGHCKETQQ